MFEIIRTQMIAPNLHQVEIHAPEVANSVQPGQFAILRVEEEGERIPLTISDWDAAAGTVTLVFLAIGYTTQKLASLAPGSSIPTLVGPLGNPMEIGNFGHVVLVGGCYGIASIYPVARALKTQGNRVSVVIEGRSRYLLYWQDKLKKVADQLVEITRDGSKGLRGHINTLPAILEHLPWPADRVILNGCNYLMQRGSEETRPLKIKTLVSLNTLMIDGTGMCGVCRVMIGDSTKFACVDGPHFDGHMVNWDELVQRRKAYLAEESQPYRSSRPQ